MNEKERQYWEGTKNHISTLNYVKFLFESDRIVEATFFCNKMLRETPKNRYVNEMAFLLAVKRMDPEVGKYDEALVLSKMENKDRFILHCRYYFAFQYRENLKASLSAAMDEGLTDMQSLSVVVESVLWLEDVYLTRKFISLYLNEKVKITPQAEREVKKILQKRLLEIFSSMLGLGHG